MKRTLVLIFTFFLVSGYSFSQNMLSIYKKGPVKLVPDRTYGSMNKWEGLFNLYYDSVRKDIGDKWNDKRIIVAPDGSVFMSHKNRHEIWKFGPDGNFLKRFGSKGGIATKFPMLPSIEPVIDGKYVFTTDVNARLKFFDLDGNYFKSITLKYMTGDFQPIGNGEILLTGTSMWKKSDPKTKTFSYNWRHIVVRLNINTGEEKIIHSFFEDGDFIWTDSKNRDSIRSKPVQTPFKGVYLPNYQLFKRSMIQLFRDGSFAVMNRSEGTVTLYDISGKQKSIFKLDITPLTVTEKDALENYESVRQMLTDRIKHAEARPDTAVTKISSGESGTTPGTVIHTTSFPGRQLIIQRTKEALDHLDFYKDVKNYYPNLPYFSNIICDDEGNMLVFEFTPKDQVETNVFNIIAYDNKGEKLARTSFICDDYELSFSSSSFVISKGYVYAVAKLKNAKGMPLRLVRFKMEPTK